jgi:DNA-binding response OmpR family regulator
MIGNNAPVASDPHDHPLILVVEDDTDLQLTTRLVLEQHGFQVEVAGNGLDGLERARAVQPDLALVDVMMPVMDGITMTRRLRSEMDVPVIMLTARDLPHDEIVGLDAGADDYITKPFDGEVLAARIRSLLRRSAAPRTSIERFGDVEIDRVAMVVQVAGQEVTLSATELRLLLTFADHPNAVLSRDQIMERVWGSADWGEGRVVDVNIQRLRTKVGADLIHTVRGLGYKLVAS